MKEENYKQLYECLLESGELKKYKTFSLDWEKDKKRFMKEQKNLENLANVIDTEIENEE